MSFSGVRLAPQAVMSPGALDQCRAAGSCDV